MLNWINLWNPSVGMSFAIVLLTAFLLGIVHGITPDEHTWPITFSYAIGSYSSRRGLLVGLLFSFAFATQRALMSEISYFLLPKWLMQGNVDYVVYIVVGLAMAGAGGYILRFDQAFHLHLFGKRLHEDTHQETAISRAPTPKMALMHGFIAGWGFGAFALIIYTVLAPSSPNVWVAWLPGAVFGLGTAVVQGAAGALFGWFSRRSQLTEHETQEIAHRVSGKTLWAGGLVFVIGGLFGLLFPKLAGYAITTPFHVHNLHHLGIAIVLVIVVVLIIGVGSIWQERKRFRKVNKENL